ncbi:hypothetical protein F4777DRAFT_582976 [Nemania sp. FL0916]|nr:hypothetical protein F4777DRAFT_582976 [Nemania sp. FL0916]
MISPSAAEESSSINPSQQIAGPSTPKLGKEPVTPDLEQQRGNRGRFGLPTPDATPEFVRVRSSTRTKEVFVPPAGPVTPSASSRASAEEAIDNRGQYSPHSVHSQRQIEESNRSSSPPSPPPYLELEEDDSFLSFITSIYDSVANFFNLATQRRSRASDARVQSAFDLIKAIPTSRRARIGNLTRTLTVKQYGELLRAIDECGDTRLQAIFTDKLRFDYTRHKKRLEIRMPTTIHEEVGEWIRAQITSWTLNLQKSTSEKAAAAAKTLKLSGSSSIRFPRRSKGDIRTVIGIDMRKMFLAEQRNERRLYQMYLNREVNESMSLTYQNDPENVTGEASFLVWRAKQRRNGQYQAECVQNTKFRNDKGITIDKSAIQFQLQDFLCANLVSSPAGEFQAHPLELSLEDLNEECIEETLRFYRIDRNEMEKDRAEEELEKRESKRAQEPPKREPPRTRGGVDRVPRGLGVLGRIRENGGGGM